MLLELLLVTLVILSIIVIELKDLLYAVIILAGANVIIAVLFYLMAAPDIAVTQAAVCAGLMTFLFVVTIHKTERLEK